MRVEGVVVRSRTPTAPRSFVSPGGRRFTVKDHEHEEGRWGREDRWDISYRRKPAGKLLRGYPYSGDKPWSATTRQLYRRYAADAPTGIGFDVASYETVGEALRAWGRSADEILDWTEGKPVRSIYSKTGSFQRQRDPKRPRYKKARGIYEVKVMPRTGRASGRPSR